VLGTQTKPFARSLQAPEVEQMRRAASLIWPNWLVTWSA
jgi:hypothetical protein